MSFRVIASRISGLFGGRRADADLHQDIDAHLDLLAADFERRGLPPDAARAAARREFGGIEQMKETYRDQRGLPLVDTLARDLRYGLRLMRRSPGFTIVAVASLALGIGATTAIFSIVDALLLRRLPVADPGRLVLFSIDTPRGSDESLSFPAYLQYRNDSDVLAGVCASGGANTVRLRIDGEGGGGVESARAEKVSGNFFSVLGVGPAVGRVLADDDDRADGPRAVAVLAYDFWKRRFGLDSSVVGRTVTINDTPLTIVGVARPGFFGFEVGAAPDVWYPLQMLPSVMHAPGASLNDRGWTWLRVVGRLRPDISPARAQAEIDVMFQRELNEQAARRGARLGAQWTAGDRRAFFEQRLGLHDGATGWTRLRPPFTRPLSIVMTAVSLVLLIACANVANLLLARASARQKEIAVRMAIGAARGRIVRQLLTESLLLAAIGGALGAMLAPFLARLMLAYFPLQDVSLDVRIDLRVLAFTAGVSMLTGVAFGLVPSLRAAAGDVVSRIKAQAAGLTAARSQLVLNRTLVVAQVAFSLLLLVGAGLFLRTLHNLRRLDVGFDADRVTTFQIDAGGYDSARRDALFRRVLDRLAVLPEIRAASLSTFGLLSDNGWGQRISIPGYVPRADENMRVNGQIGGPRLFETLGTALVRGRDFTSDDAQPRPDGRGRVAVVNQAMVHRYFADRDPIGRVFTAGGAVPLTIVGVVEDVKYRSIREAAPPTFYVPAFQAAMNPETTFLIRSDADRAVLSDTIRRAVREVDPAVLVRYVLGLDERVDASIARERFVAQLATAFGLFALVLAAIGLYGLMAYSVARRTQDLAIRVALGAARRRVVWMVLREELALLAGGFAIGVPAALATSKLVESLLFGIAPTDPATTAAAVLLMTVVGLLAGYVPARRAARIDPMTALKCE